jgi:hypothetical protein
VVKLAIKVDAGLYFTMSGCTPRNVSITWLAKLSIVEFVGGFVPDIAALSSPGISALSVPFAFFGNKPFFEASRFADQYAS